MGDTGARRRDTSGQAVGDDILKITHHQFLMPK
jgi:hypothetical protein